MSFYFSVDRFYFVLRSKLDTNMDIQFVLHYKNYSQYDSFLLNLLEKWQLCPVDLFVLYDSINSKLIVIFRSTINNLLHNNMNTTIITYKGS